MRRSYKTAPHQPPLTVFFAAAIVIFCCTLSAADSIGFVPYYIDGTSPSSASAASADSQDLALSSLPQLGVSADASSSTADGALAAAAEGVAYPVHISIPAVGIDLPVQNPSTTDVDALDNLLSSGPARYADSARLGQLGTMVIFAHSSHLPIVHNKMYQAFNQVPNVQPGDTITLTGSDGSKYLYSADSVAKADVNDGTNIDLAASAGTRLVLVTCDTLTGKSARFVLTATYVGKE